MFKYLLPLFLLIPAWSQTTPVIPPTPPAPPACLSGPVTLGSVTMSCTLLDTNPINGGSDFSSNDLRNGNIVFQVRLSSTDPDVIAFRVGVTLLYDAGTGLQPFTLWASVGKSPSAYQPPPASPSPYYRYTFLIPGSNVSSIEVQELKVSNSQKF